VFSDEVLRGRFAQIGYAAAEKMAIGMQGAVFRLPGARIGKLWFHADEAELRTLGALYAALDGRLPFRTPQWLDLHRSDQWWITVETELSGTPLYQRDVQFGTPDWDRSRDCVIDVLAGLAELDPPDELRRLAVLDEVDPFRPDDVTWSDALAGLVQRRLERFGDQLRAVVDDVDTKIASLLRLLALTDEPTPRLVHGDVTAGNILVDEHLRPVALLDFGMLTMSGDPAYDAAAAGSLHQLWSPEIRDIEASVDAAASDQLGYDPELLMIYRCVHFLLISNAHDADPYSRDSAVPLAGQFLNTPEVTALLLG
jgi:Phosphotransferase enzyme family